MIVSDVNGPLFAFKLITQWHSIGADIDALVKRSNYSQDFLSSNCLQFVIELEIKQSNLGAI